MSLINDALKRTRDASYQAGHARPMSTESYRVSSRNEATGFGSRSGVWVTLVVVMLAATAVLVFALRLTKPAAHIREALVMTEPDTARSASAPYQANPGRAVSPKPPPVVIAAVPVPPAPAAPAPVPVAPPPAPELPKFTLQGVTSTANWREAMVNGYTVREGDEVDGAKVILIEARRVKLQIGEREILLRMP